MVARFLTGIGKGIETLTVPMYQSELCEANKRSRLVASEPLFVGVGIVIAYWFNCSVLFVLGSIAWRLPIACHMIFATIVIVLVFGLPELPHYLYNHGRHTEALQNSCDVYDGPSSDPNIEKENREILEALSTAVGISANLLWNFFGVMITPTLLESLAWKGYLIFMALSFCFIPWSTFATPRRRIRRSRSLTGCSTMAGL